MNTVIVQLPQHNPWKALTRKAGSLAILRTPQPGQLDIYLGLNQNEEYMFLLRLPEQNNETRSKTPLPSIDGCRVEYQFHHKHLFCCLILENNEDWRIFAMLCGLLRDALEAKLSQQNSVLIEHFIHQLQVCQAFFSHKKEKILDKKAAQGLYGELCFLRDCVMPNIPQEDWLSSWTGPLGSKQDFSVRDTVVEIKTKTVTSGNAINISSIDQLCPYGSQGYLCVNRISTCIEGESLVDLVTDIERRLEDCGAKENLRLLLSFVGYKKCDEQAPLYQTKWKMSEHLLYEITDDFPRITSEDLREGIIGEQVKYAIDQNSLGRFKGCPEWLEH